MTAGGRRCPVCDSARAVRTFAARDRHYGIPGEWWVQECRECSSWFLEQPPTAEELRRLYAPDYYAFAVRPPSRLRAWARRALRFDRRTREPDFAQPGRVLDFGCGAGEFLLSLRAKGWACHGVELSEIARERAGKAGLDVRAAITGPDGFAAGSFDYVRANHSLEHVLCPAQTLREMHDVLRPGGTLFLGVPTTSSENARVFGESWWHVTAPLHTFVPSTSGLLDLLQRTGFRVTRVSTNGDFAGTAGSLQIRLNRGRRPSSQGLLFTLKPLLLLAHWYAKVQDARGLGDQLEVIAVKPEAGDVP